MTSSAIDSVVSNTRVNSRPLLVLSALPLAVIVVVVPPKVTPPIETVTGLTSVDAPTSSWLPLIEVMVTSFHWSDVCPGSGGAPSFQFAFSTALTLASRCAISAVVLPMLRAPVSAAASTADCSRACATQIRAKLTA